VSASLYEPIYVYKPVAPNIGVVDGPFEYLTVAGIRLPLPFTTRMTVVRLSDGDLFLHSPVRFERRLADELEKLGRVRHLISPNQFHYAHIGEWRTRFLTQLHGRPRVCANEREQGISIFVLHATSTLHRPKSGVRTSTRHSFQEATSRSSFSFTERHEASSSPTRSSTSSWIK
jgi:hypothetical protein